MFYQVVLKPILGADREDKTFGIMTHTDSIVEYGNDLPVDRKNGGYWMPDSVDSVTFHSSIEE